MQDSHSIFFYSPTRTFVSLIHCFITSLYLTFSPSDALPAKPLICLLKYYFKEVSVLKGEHTGLRQYLFKCTVHFAVKEIVPVILFLFF